ncbi:MAG: DUF6356 family protein [Sphingomicrobium sp.]
MTFIDRIFLDHPRSVGETYAEHAGIALRFGWTMASGGAACMIHAVLPSLFPRSASTRIKRLHQEVTERERAFATTRAANPGGEWQLEYEI